MEKKEILQGVQQVLCPKYLPADWERKNPYSIRLETDLIRDLGIDSLATTDLVGDLEDYFNLSIPDEDIDKLFSTHNSIRESVFPVGKIHRAPVSAIVNYIHQRVRDQSLLMQNSSLQKC